MADPTKRSRSNESYVIEAALKVLQVLEHLQGQQYAPVSVAEMAARSGFNYDFCRRALRTLFAAGWAVETERGWQLSVKAGQFSDHWMTWMAAINSHANSEFRIENFRYGEKTKDLAHSTSEIGIENK